MQLKIDDIEIPKSNPFQNCELGRKPYADILESLVCNGKGGCVMSLDGAWGTGKTTFVKMWQQQLNNHEFKTIYFNAWEHDYMTDPLVALMGELYNLSINSKIKNSFTKVVAEAEKIFCGIFPSLGKAVIKNYLGDEAADIVSDALDETKNIFQKELDKYKKECDSLNAFRAALADYAENISCDKPLVFIVDELDRCNPTYAVKVLERIKHLFAIPHVVFVLAIDKEQLCNSIRGFYGSDRINAAEYLRRFIDVELYLPTPDYEKFFDYLYSKLGLADYFEKNAGSNGYGARSYEEIFHGFPLKFITSKVMSLRQIEKLMAHVRLALQTIPTNYEPCPDLIAFFVYLRQYYHSLYLDIQNRSLDVQELIDGLEKVIPVKLYSERNDYNRVYSHSTIYLVAKMLFAYVSDYRGDVKVEFYEDAAEDKIQLKFNTHFPINEMQNAVKYYSKQFHNVSIDYVLRHIELLCRLQND